MSTTAPATCSADCCEAGVDTRGYCQAHYLRVRKHGDPLAHIPVRRKKPVVGICEVEGCDRERAAQGLCGSHYNRKLRHGTALGGGGYREKRLSGQCCVDECAREARCKGYCSMHYARYTRHGDPLKGGRKPAQGIIDAGGYRYFERRDHPNASKHGMIAEHRLVMSEHLGRPLQPNEEVHHRNGDRLDNRIENLELWSTSQPKGQRVVDKLAWAYEILATYAPLADRL